ncbi:hypothetical protein KF707_08515 [Candidatus Obscuribacterales bacterium]|nr:hypothetical protein [Candidatus Obscuribacterales bacterium]MBX3154220.1 hypothetical protein [Candidatus Obscuribacterales bacterium]
MNYTEYEEWIKQAAEAASGEARSLFALDTLRGLHLEARGAIQNECTEQERELVSRILESLGEDAEQLSEQLEELDGLLYRDPTRKIRYIPSLMEFMCALAHYIDYRKTSNPAYIAAIGLNMVNLIDYEVSGQVDGYSMNDMLVSEEMSAEIERQQQALLSEYE